MESIQKERAKEAEVPEGWKADWEEQSCVVGDLIQRVQVVERWQQEATEAAVKEEKDRQEKDHITGRELGILDQERRCMVVRV